MPRGGKRTGTPGKSYSNRKDLQVNKGRHGINTPAPHQTYGQGAAQAQAMKTVPLAAPDAPAPTPPDGAGAPDLMAAATDWQPLPGSPTQTARPNEPVTHGLPSGPGAGPEVLPSLLSEQSMAPSPLQSAVGLLASLGDDASPQVKAVRAQLAAAMSNQAPR